MSDDWSQMEKKHSTNCSRSLYAHYITNNRREEIINIRASRDQTIFIKNDLLDGKQKPKKEKVHIWTLVKVSYSSDGCSMSITQNRSSLSITVTNVYFSAKTFLTIK
jgi:hypothetical protein